MGAVFDGRKYDKNFQFFLKEKLPYMAQKELGTIQVIKNLHFRVCLMVSKIYLIYHILF